jgi:hypothetical protein
MALNCSDCILINLPLENIPDIPLRSHINPIVVTIGGTESFSIKTPFPKPIPKQAKQVTIIDKGSPIRVDKNAIIIEVKPITDPTEISTPRSRIIKVSPMVANPKIEARRRIDVRLFVLKNTLGTKTTAINVKAKIISGISK